MTTRRVATIVATIVLGALFTGAAATWRVGSELVKPVNHPVPLPAGFAASVVAIPGPEHVIAGWWIDQGEDSPAVLLLHGFRADRSSMVGRAKLLVDNGFSVLMIDLQGHGETLGAAITMGWREADDVRAGLRWLESAGPSRRIGVIGCSLGGAAVLLGPQPSGFDAVVLEAVYPRATRAIENRVRIRLGRLAVVLSPLLIAQVEPRLHVSPQDLEPIRSIPRLGAPLLVVAGSQDQHTTLAESEELFRAGSEPKRLWVVNGARHQDFLKFDPQGYASEVVGFLREYLQ